MKTKCMVCEGGAILPTNEKHINNWVPCLYCEGSGIATKKQVYAKCDAQGRKNELEHKRSLKLGAK